MSSVESGVLLALVALLPLIVLTLTSFVKLSVVLAFVRNALGAQDAPSGLVITGLSLVLTFFVMAPVAVRMVQAAATQPAPATQPTPTQPTQPTPAGAPPAPMSVDAAVRALVPPQYQGDLAAVERAIGPLREFLVKHSRQVDRETFAKLAVDLGNAGVRGDELWVVAPAFIATELREAFAIAVLIFVPFLVIDLVVALGLASMGLSATSPQTIALPLKLVLFVAVDGWRLLLDALLRGYV
jgi:type III secretion protein R